MHYWIINFDECKNGTPLEDLGLNKVIKKGKVFSETYSNIHYVSFPQLQETLKNQAPDQNKSISLIFLGHGNPNEVGSNLGNPGNHALSCSEFATYINDMKKKLVEFKDVKIYIFACNTGINSQTHYSFIESVFQKLDARLKEKISLTGVAGYLEIKKNGKMAVNPIYIGHGYANHSIAPNGDLKKILSVISNHDCRVVQIVEDKDNKGPLKLKPTLFKYKNCDGAIMNASLTFLLKQISENDKKPNKKEHADLRAINPDLKALATLFLHDQNERKEPEENTNICY